MGNMSTSDQSCVWFKVRIVQMLCYRSSAVCTSRRTGLLPDQGLCIAAFIKHFVHTALVSNTRMELEVSLLMQGGNSRVEEPEYRR